MLPLWCPSALRWVTLGIEFHRSGSAGATRDTGELASVSGGWKQLKADADAPTPVPLAPGVSAASRHANVLQLLRSAALPQPAGTPLLPASP